MRRSQQVEALTADVAALTIELAGARAGAEAWQSIAALAIAAMAHDDRVRFNDLLGDLEDVLTLEARRG